MGSIKKAFDLTGRNALVTGGSRGLGLQIAEALHTGDAGFLDENGYLFIHDRFKDMIVSGSKNVYPAEIESALYGHEDIADVAVIGVPDDKWGEAVKALIILKPDPPGDAARIMKYAREKLAGFKIPKTIEFVNELPRNPSWEGYERRVN